MALFIVACNADMLMSRLNSRYHYHVVAPAVCSALWRLYLCLDMCFHSSPSVLTCVDTLLPALALALIACPSWSEEPEIASARDARTRQRRRDTRSRRDIALAS
eukprot:4514824-Amphidinium_carterae.2